MQACQVSLFNTTHRTSYFGPKFKHSFGSVTFCFVVNKIVCTLYYTVWRIPQSGRSQSSMTSQYSHHATRLFNLPQRLSRITHIWVPFTQFRPKWGYSDSVYTAILRNSKLSHIRLKNAKSGVTQKVSKIFFTFPGKTS